MSSGIFSDRHTISCLSVGSSHQVLLVPYGSSKLRTFELLSICIPTLNRADLLRKNLDHLTTFKELDFEVNISNNGSVDHTQQVIEEYADKFSKFNVNTFDNTIGRVENWDAAIKMASQKYVFALADDDKSLEQGLLETVELMEANEDIGAVYGGLKEFSLDEEFITDNKKCERLEVYDSTQRLELLQKYWSFEVPVFRKALYEQSPPVHGNAGALSWLFLSSIFKFGFRVAVSPSFLFKHYVHKDRVTEQMAADAHLNFVLTSEVEIYLADTNATPQDKIRALFLYQSQLYNFQAQVCLRNSDFIQARFFINKGFLYNPEHFGPLVHAWDKMHLVGATFQEIKKRIANKKNARRVFFVGTSEAERRFIDRHLSDLQLDYVDTIDQVISNSDYDPQLDFLLGFEEEALEGVASIPNAAVFRSILNSLKFTNNKIEISLDG